MMLAWISLYYGDYNVVISLFTVFRRWHSNIFRKVFSIFFLSVWIYGLLYCPFSDYLSVGPVCVPLNLVIMCLLDVWLWFFLRQQPPYLVFVPTLPELSGHSPPTPNNPESCSMETRLEVQVWVSVCSLLHQGVVAWLLDFSTNRTGNITYSVVEIPPVPSQPHRSLFFFF